MKNRFIADDINIILREKKPQTESAQVHSYDICPVCGEAAKVRCKCRIYCRRCQNGHEWFTCQDCGKTVVDTNGKDFSHHSNPYCESCIQKREDDEKD
jgi:hypothetical protein